MDAARCGQRSWAGGGMTSSTGQPQRQRQCFFCWGHGWCASHQVVGVGNKDAYWADRECEIDMRQALRGPTKGDRYAPEQ